jgi:lipopolysaccharide export system protein LptA
VSRRARLVRRASAFLLSVWVLVLVGVFVHRQLRRKPAVSPVEIEEVSGEQKETPVRVQKGFVYNDVLGVEPNFRIAAQEAVEFASGWYELHDVTMSLFHQGTVSYGLVAKQARFNTVEKSATASGDVQLSLSAGIAVRADKLVLDGGSRVLSSRGSVTFAGPGWGGVAQGMAVDLASNRLDLKGGVSLSWRSGSADRSSLILLAQELLYYRDRGLVECPRGLTFLRSGLRVEAPGAEIRIDAQSGGLIQAKLLGSVRLGGTLDDGGMVAGRTGDMLVQPLLGERFRIAAEPEAGSGWVSLHWSAPGNVSRELLTWRLVGEGSRDAWEWLEGQELVCGDESDATGATRTFSSDRLRLDFSQGKPTTARATGSVRVDLDGRWAAGDELVYSLANRNFTLLPSQGGRVTAGSEDLTAESDRIEGQPGGEIVASGQVYGTVAKPADGEQGGNVTRFAADRVVLAGETVRLDGNARLWQPERLVRADRLDYDRMGDIVVGKGNVLTTGTAPQASKESRQVRVRASSVRYDRRAGEAHYEGNVELEDPRAVASCQKLDVTLGSQGGLLLGSLEGGVTIRETGTGRVLKGDRARFVTATNTVQVWGSPVILQEPGGNQVSGNTLTWNRESNSMLVEGTKEQPSETIYGPAPGTPHPGKKGGGGVAGQ